MRTRSGCCGKLRSVSIHPDRSLPTNWPYRADHLQCRQMAHSPLVAYVAAGAVDRLFERIAGQHAKQHRHAACDADLGQARAHGPVDVLVVRRFAANDRPQAKHRRVAAAGGQPSATSGISNAPGTQATSIAVVGHAVGGERLRARRPAAASDRFVVPRHHDRKRPGGVGVTLKTLATMHRLLPAPERRLVEASAPDPGRQPASGVSRRCWLTISCSSGTRRCSWSFAAG